MKTQVGSPVPGPGAIGAWCPFGSHGALAPDNAKNLPEPPGASRSLPEAPGGQKGRPGRTKKRRKTSKMARNRLRTLRLSYKHAHPDRTGVPVPMEPIIPQNPPKITKRRGFWASAPLPPGPRAYAAGTAPKAHVTLVTLRCCHAPSAQSISTERDAEHHRSGHYRSGHRASPKRTSSKWTSSKRNMGP